MIGPDNSAKIGADYKAGKKDGKGFLEASASFVSKPGESSDVRRDTYLESAAWYDAFTADLFGKEAAPAGPPAKDAP